MTQVRHLVLHLKPGARVRIACAESPDLVPFDRSQHTLATMLTTCQACRVIFAAEHAVYLAEHGNCDP